MKQLLTLIVSGLMLATTSMSSEVDPSIEIDRLFYTYDRGVRPGYAIGVLDRGELIHAKGYGYANLAREQRIDANTAFNLASISKQFTGAMVVLAIEKGQLELSDSLAQHWPDLPEFMRPIRIDHLVYMTSGLPEYYSLPSPVGGWSSEDKFTVRDSIGAVFAANRLDYPPGSQWTYSNINYQLLAELVAKLNNESFSSLCDSWIFARLGMDHTWVDAPIDNDRPYRATSYEGNRILGWQEAPRQSPHYGGSGVFSTLNDLAKWDKALYYERTLGSNFRTQMLRTRKFDHNKTNDAFGLVKGEYRGLTTIWYAGDDYGVSTYMVHLPELRQTVICLANFADADCGAKAQEVMDLLIL